MHLATSSRIILLALALIALVGHSGCGEPDPAAAAWGACTMFVQSRTGLPADDAERYNPAGVTALAPDRHLVKVYYPKADGYYRCEVLHRPDDNWQLMALDFVR